MDLSINEDDQLLGESVRSFVQREGTTEKLVELAKSGTGFETGWQKTMADAGWLGVLLPEGLGGAGATTLQAAIIAEELGRGPICGPYLASSVIGALLLNAADPGEERDNLVGAIASGDATVVATLGEGGAGPRGFAGAADAIAGDTLNATVPFVPYAGDATHLLVPLRSPTGTLEWGIVDILTDGVGSRPLVGFLAGTHEVTFTDVEVNTRLPVTAGQLRRALAEIYVLIAAYSVGGCQALLEMSIDYSRTRIQFGRPIGKFQRVQDHIAELVNALDAARWVMYEAVWRIDTGRDALGSAHLAKALAADGYITCADEAHKVHGGIGVDPDYGLTLYTQVARSLYNHLGSPRWHKRAMADELGWTVP